MTDVRVRASCNMTFPKTLKTVVLSLLVVVSAVALLAVLLPTPRERYIDGYPRIQVGDEKRHVVSLLGEPDEIADCYTYWHSGSDESKKAACAEQYYYRGGFEQWIFVFDKEGKVISKSHNIP